MKEIEEIHELDNLKIITMRYVTSEYGSHYEIELEGGIFANFHGGSVGYENATPWYYMEKRNKLELLDT